MPVHRECTQNVKRKDCVHETFVSLGHIWWNISIFSHYDILFFITNIYSPMFPESPFWTLAGPVCAAQCVCVCAWPPLPSHICLPSLCLITAHTYLCIASCDCVKTLGLFFPLSQRQGREKWVSLLVTIPGRVGALVLGRFCCYRDKTNKVSAIQTMARLKRVRPS